MRSIAAVLLLPLLALSSHSQVLMPDGSFENGMTGWTTTGTVEALGPPRTSMPVGTDGIRAAAIGTFDSPNASISKTLALTPNTNYRMSFDLLSSGVGVGGLLGQVQVLLANGVTTYSSNLFSAISPATVHNGAEGFEPKAFLFSLPIGVSSLTLTITDFSPNGGSGVDPIVDNIRIQVVPEPNVLGIVLSGAAVILIGNPRRHFNRA